MRVGDKRNPLKLIRDKEQEHRSFELFNELKAAEPEDITEVSNLRIFKAFRLVRDWSQRSQKPATVELSRHFLQAMGRSPAPSAVEHARGRCPDGDTQS